MLEWKPDRPMPKLVPQLSAMAVSKLEQTARVGGVPGLELRFNPSGNRSWVLYVSTGGKRPVEMGLGPYPEVGLADAREAARKARLLARDGINPVAQRKAARSAQRAAKEAQRTFKQCAVLYMDEKSSEFKNAKHRAQWASTLTTYAYPKLGHLLVQDIGVPQVLAVLEPIWQTKNETASRVRGRIESVLGFATVRGYRTGDNPARWRGHLDKTLAKPSKIAKVIHHASIPYADMPAFMAELRTVGGLGARALELAALTAARSGEVRGATWAEIDLDAALWTIAGERMKAGKEHRVPLSKAAVALLEALPRADGAELVFPAAKGGMLSDMTLSAVMRRMKAPGVPHGLRSSFRTWAAEQTSFPRELAEAALAHTLGAVEGAYNRGDLLEKRRKLMQAWADYLARPPATATVTPIRGSSRASAA